MGERSDQLEKKEQENPVDSPGNPFGSRPDKTKDFLENIVNTVKKLGDNYDKQFSQLSSKFENLCSMLNSNKSTVMGVDLEAAVNKDTKKEKRKTKRKKVTATMRTVNLRNKLQNKPSKQSPRLKQEGLDRMVRSSKLSFETYKRFSIAWI